MATNPSTNFSYTNKDFATVYPELLNLVKKLSTKWDPSISNESDPGVILLKLNAIIADKNNFNIDKNILEFYPETASQEVNVRNIYKQLGYIMSWYRSGTGTVSMSWSGQPSINNITIPKFTAISNDEKSIIYTIEDETLLPMTGESVDMVIRAGIPIELNISGRKILTTSDLDTDNRLYFSDTAVAENAIYITSYRDGEKQHDYTSWKKVDNLLMESLGSTCYEFGIDANYGLPYIEFPVDIDTLIPEGISVTYLRSNGELDNITSWSLNTFFDDNQYVFDGMGNQYELNDTNFSFLNSSNIDDSFNPESQDEARKNYKKTLGTFDTLVTLRDYINAIYNSDLVSNGVVTDRTTDLQNGFTVVTNDGFQRKKSTFTTDMTAFDLKLYALQYVGTPSSFDSYNTGFTLISGIEPNLALLSYLEDQKCIQHDFANLATDRICILKNKYYIGCKIMATQKLNTEQKRELILKIQTAIFQQLNAHAVEFGEYVDFQKVFEILVSSSEFIKSLSLDSLEFYTYASYFDENEVYQEICVSDEHPYIEGYKVDNIMYEDKAKSKSIVGEVNKFYLDLYTDNLYKFANGEYTLVSDKRGTFRNDIKQHCILGGSTNLFTLQEDFDYNVFQKFLSSMEAETVDTNSVIELQTKDVYTVHENEVVQFFAPSLVNETSYSTFVKYVFYSDIVEYLPANTNYTLSGNEWVVFFWKNTDQDLRYTYYKYSAGAIVFSNIDLAQDGTAQGYVSSLSSNTEGKVIQTSVNNYLKQYQTGVLSSQTSVVIKRHADVVLNRRTNECFFITNKTVSSGGIEYYTMFDEPEVNSASTSWGTSSIDIDVPKLYSYVNGDHGTLAFLYDGVLDFWSYNTSRMKNGLAEAGIVLDPPIELTPSMMVYSDTGTATITDKESVLAFLQGYTEKITFTYTTRWPDEFVPGQYGLELNSTWNSGDQIQMLMNQGIAVAATDSTVGTIKIVNYDLLHDRIYEVNRARTCTCTAPNVWDVDPSGLGITLQGTWEIGDKIDLRIQDENLTINFDSGVSNSKLLSSGEYFLYKDGSSVLKIYGSGTKITRDVVLQNGIYQYPEPWLCPVIEPSLILEQGINAIKTTDWLKFYNTTNTVTITEMQFVNVLPGGTIQLAAFQDPESTKEAHIVIDNKGSTVLSTEVTDYTTSSAPYYVDIAQLQQNETIVEKGVYTFTPWVDSTMGSVVFDDENIGLSTKHLFIYSVDSWNIDPALYGVTPEGNWENSDSIELTYINGVLDLTVDASDTGTATITDETLARDMMSISIIDIETLFRNVGGAGAFIFTYNSNGNWVFDDHEVGTDLSSFGIHYAGTPSNNDKITASIVRDSLAGLFKMTSTAMATAIQVVGANYGISSTNSPETYNIYAVINIELTDEFNKANVTYTNAGDSSSTDLPVSTADNGYEGISILNLNCGPSSPQQLYTNQTITLYNQEETSVIHSDTDIVNIVSSMNITAEGGIGVNLGTLNFDNTYIYPTISSYINQLNHYPGNVSVAGDETTLKFPKGATTYKFDINYPDGNYIMPISNTYDFESLKFYLDNDPSIEITSSKGTATINDSDALFLEILNNNGPVTLTYNNGVWEGPNGAVLPSTLGIEVQGTWTNGEKIVSSLNNTGTSIEYLSSNNSVTIENEETFKDALDDYGVHTFIYDGSNWTLNSVTVNLSYYGIVASGTFQVGELFRAMYMPIEINEIYDETLTEFKDPGFYYLVLPCFDTASDGVIAAGHTLRVVGVNDSSNDLTYTIKFLNLDRIMNPVNYKAIRDLAYATAEYLVGSKYKFDCTYQIPADQNISNPLASLSFMDPLHLYNKFTICQALGANIQLMN